MRRLLSILTASLLVSSMLVAPAYAKEKGEKAEPGESAGARAGNGENGGGGSGKAKGGENGAAVGKGQANTGGQKAGGKAAAKPGASAATARAISPQLAGVKAGTKANVVEVNDLIKGKRRAALNKSLAANQAGIDRLRSSLVRLRLSGLASRDAGDAIATRREADGSLTVFVDRGAQ